MGRDFVEDSRDLQAERNVSPHIDAVEPIALQLADQGHQVRLLTRDGGELPDLTELAILVGLGYVFGRSTRVEHNAVWLEGGIAVVMALILVVPVLFKWRLTKRQRAK